MADADVVNQIIKLAAMLQKKKEYPEPEKDDKEKKYPKAEEEDKMNEHTEKMEETINELSEQVATLTKKLNEPDKVSEKGETAEHTLSEDQKEEYVKQNLDEAFLNMLNNS
jgi:predicted  nucleic acid-binding Zn-ribbon protein